MPRVEIVKSRAALMSPVLGSGDERALQVSLPQDVTLNFSKATIPQKVNRKSTFWKFGMVSGCSALHGRAKTPFFVLFLLL